MLVANRILFSSSGRLHQRLQIDEQLVEEIDGDAWGFKDPGLWTITATIKDAVSVDSVRAIIVAELRRLSDETVSSDELNKAIKGIKSDRVFRLDRPSRVALTLGRYAILSGSADNVKREMELLDTVTPAMLQNFAREYLSEDKRTTVVLTPKLAS
jgi:zinc protease